MGGVYKLAAVEQDGEFIPKIKISENVEKITNPAFKEVYRIYNADGVAVADLLTVRGEDVDMTKPYRYIDPQKPWKERYFEGCRAVPLKVKYIEGGKLIRKLPGVREIAAFVKDQLKNEIWDEEQRFENPHTHYLDMSPTLYDMKMKMLGK